MADVFYELSHSTITWGPNLMNKVNVSLAALTSLACDLLSLHEGQTEALTLQAQCRREKKELILQPIKNIQVCYHWFDLF